MNAIPQAEGAAQRQRFLTFLLDDETFGVDIGKIREIVGMMPLTRVPKTPPFVRGVINLRGQIIPVVDLHARFNLPVARPGPTTCIIVAEIPYDNDLTPMGLVVDDVAEVADIAAAEISPCPSLDGPADPSFIAGITGGDAEAIVLLDLDKVLSPGEISVMDALTRAADQ